MPIKGSYCSFHFETASVEGASEFGKEGIFEPVYIVIELHLLPLYQ